VEPIFEAVLKGEREVSRLLRGDPSLARARASEDSLIDSIPHWLYAGDTSLHLAAAGLVSGVVRVLLRSGADPNAQNRRSATPLHYACDPRWESGGTWNPTVQASVIKMLVAEGAEVKRGDQGGATPLHRAVRARSVAAVSQLLDLGARTDTVLKKRRSSPLHLAALPTGASGTGGAYREQLEIIDLLLRHGADPAGPDAAGRTPVDWATNETVAKALQGRPALVKGRRRSAIG
jgi:ankyrin repeat protein